MSDTIQLDTIYNEDCLDTMSRMPDNFIDLTVTSPPYDDLRTYNGFYFDFEKIAKELYRVTKDGRIVVWIVNDSTNKGSESLTSFKQVIYFKEVCGFLVHDTMLYHKDVFFNRSVNRYWPSFEFMFILSKGIPTTVNLICDRKNTYIGQRTKHTIRERDGKMSVRQPSTVSEYGKRSNSWHYNTGYMKTTLDKEAYLHPAMFPELLALDHILSWSNPHDIVYDPFSGSGTTPIMATLNDRHFIASEISAEYVELSRSRLEKRTAQLKLL